MIHFVFSPKDTRYLFLKTDTEEDDAVMERLLKHVNLVDPICYLPTYNGTPYTQDFIFSYFQPTGKKIWYCSIGLWQDIYKFFTKNGVAFDGLIENKELFKVNIPHTFEQFKAIVDGWGLKYQPRPYQYEAAYKILQYKQSVSQLATRAGKTLIAYMIFRYEMEYLGMKRILMIVPQVDLVKQAYNDFKEYAEFFKTECVWAGGKLVESANISVGTFQSLIKFLDRRSPKYNPKFFDGYDCVFVDETHRATANQIKTIISQPFMKNVKIAFGMTGTLPKEGTIDHFCLHSLLGAKIQTIKPKELMDAGYIAGIDITQVRLTYKDVPLQRELYIKCAEYALSDFELETDPETGKKKKIKLPEPQFLIQHKKKLPYGIDMAKRTIYGNPFVDEEKHKEEYVEVLKNIIKDSTKTNYLVIEKMMAHFMEQRIDYLCNKILPECTHNTILFCHHTEYLKHVAKAIKKRFPERHIVTIFGSTTSKKRDEVKKLLSENNDCILVASYACVGTGLTLSNLCYGILFESFKSETINMQSIGRGLGLSEMRDKFKLYDIIDVFDKKAISNKIYLQGLEKIKIYKENEYQFKIKNVEI